MGDDRPLSSMSDAQPDEDPTIGDLARDSAPPEQGRLLYQLTRAFQPGQVVELGTNIGTSTATALEVNQSGRLVTLEASGHRLGLGRSLLGDLGLDRIEMIEGYFDDTLVPGGWGLKCICPS